MDFKVSGTVNLLTNMLALLISRTVPTTDNQQVWWKHTWHNDNCNDQHTWACWLRVHAKVLAIWWFFLYWSFWRYWPRGPRPTVNNYTTLPLTSGGIALDLRSLGHGFVSPWGKAASQPLASCSHLCASSSSSITWYWSEDSDVLWLGRWIQIRGR